MIKTASPVDARPVFSEQTLRRLAERAGDGENGLAARLAARDIYAETPLPDRVAHLWRFSDPEQLLPLDVEAPSAPGDALPDPVPGAAATIDLWPGLAPRLFLGPDLPDGQLSLVSSPPSAAAGTDSVFTHLNRSAWNTGCGLRIAAGAELPGPIHLRIHAGEATTLPRLTVEIGDRARVTLVEEHIGGGAEARVVGRTEFVAGEGARLTHVQLQQWQDGTRGHLSVFGRAGREADVLTVFGQFGGGLCKAELMTELAGEGAHSRMVGSGLATGAQRFDVHTRHRHTADHTTSEIDYKTVTADTARSSYTGLIRIEEHARHCEAFQENRNLLLSPRSRADAIPELEIHNQEVSCSHGATVSPVDREQLFYLVSRGLDPAEAVGLVVRGSLENTLSRLPADLRASVEAFVGPRLARIREVPA